MKKLLFGITGFIAACVLNALLICSIALFTGLFALSEAGSTENQEKQIFDASPELTDFLSASMIKNGVIEITPKLAGEIIAAALGQAGITLDFVDVRFDTDRVRIRCGFELPDDVSPAFILPFIGETSLKKNLKISGEIDAGIIYREPLAVIRVSAVVVGRLNIPGPALSLAADYLAGNGFFSSLPVIKNINPDTLTAHADLSEALAGLSPSLTIRSVELGKDSLRITAGISTESGGKLITAFTALKPRLVALAGEIAGQIAEGEGISSDLLSAVGIIDEIGASSRNALSAVIVCTQGDVKLVRGESQKPAAVGQELAENDGIITGDGSAEIMLNNASLIRIDANTRIQISQLRAKENTDSTALYQFYGKVRCKVEKLTGSDHTFSLRTRTAACGVRGTDFILESAENGDCSVFVLSGTVEISPGDGGPHTLVLARQKTRVISGLAEKIEEIFPREVQSLEALHFITTDPHSSAHRRKDLIRDLVPIVLGLVDTWKRLDETSQQKLTRFAEQSASISAVVRELVALEEFRFLTNP